MSYVANDEVRPDSPMIRAIEKRGGVVPVRYGQVACLVAEVEGEVVGMVHTAPPVDWLATFPKNRARALAQRILQIELLAVDPEHRGQGVGQALLESAENRLLDQRGHLVYAKVRAGDYPVMRWYRRRGYTIAAQGQSVLINTTQGLTGIEDCGDGYQLAAKAVQPGTKIERFQDQGSEHLIAARSA